MAKSKKQLKDEAAELSDSQQQAEDTQEPVNSTEETEQEEKLDQEIEQDEIDIYDGNGLQETDEDSPSESESDMGDKGEFDEEPEEPDEEKVLYKSTHNGIFVVGGVELKPNETTELSEEVLALDSTKHAIKTGMLVVA